MKQLHPIAVGVAVAFLAVLMGSGCQNSGRANGGAAGAAGAALSAGCGTTQQRKSVLDVRALLEEQKTAADIVMVGRINGLSQPTWDPERAAFMVADRRWRRNRKPCRRRTRRDAQARRRELPVLPRQAEKGTGRLALVEVVDCGRIDPAGGRSPAAGSAGRSDGRGPRAGLRSTSLGTLVVRTDRHLCETVRAREVGQSDERLHAP